MGTDPLEPIHNPYRAGSKEKLRAYETEIHEYPIRLFRFYKNLICV